MSGDSLETEYFDRLYEAKPDPWNISQGWYEERKRNLVMAALPRRRYELGAEPGCGNGELTRLLARRCDRMTVWDAAATAVAATRVALSDQRHVDVHQARVPEDWPAAQADLVIVSELGYYLGHTDLDRLITRACAGLRAGGTLVAVHWRRPAPDYPLGGDDVHAHFFGRSTLGRIGGYADDDFRIDVFASTPPPVRSVAQQGGIVA